MEVEVTDGCICAIEGCTNPVDRKGWCTRHYQRWYRNGDPLAGRTSSSVIQDFIRQAATHSGGCLAWPFKRGSTGYAFAVANGKSATVSRLVCEIVHGPPPSAEYQAAHSCGKGHEGCVSGGHLSWKTRSENEADKIEHGTKILGHRHPNAKLNEAMVRAIRASYPGASHAKLAVRFSVSEPTIRQVVNRVTWKHVA